MTQRLRTLLHLPSVSTAVQFESARWQHAASRAGHVPAAPLCASDAQPAEVCV
jgi:hypothetical protein